MMFLNLGDPLYGFWSLLWAVFGYSIIFDFGFVRTVQKYTAEQEYVTHLTITIALSSGLLYISVGHVRHLCSFVPVDVWARRSFPVRGSNHSGTIELLF